MKQKPKKGNCTTIRISQDTKKLLTEIQAQHFLRTNEELKNYNVVIQYLYWIWRQNDD